MRPVLAALALFSTLLPATAGTIELRHRPGGFTYLNIAQANRWLATGTRLVIADWQVSAAAVQVLYFKRRGGNVCYAKSRFNADPALFFHLSRTPSGYQNDLAHYIGRGNASKIGKLSAYSYKRFHPSVFGIRACAPGLKPTKRTTTRAAAWNW